MTITTAKIVGEKSPGYITIVLNPEVTGTPSVNMTTSELIATLPTSTVPEELREEDLDIWFATAQLTDSSKKNIKAVFLRTSEDIPDEYYAWLRENGIDAAAQG